MVKAQKSSDRADFDPRTGSGTQVHISSNVFLPITDPVNCSTMPSPITWLAPSARAAITTGVNAIPGMEPNVVISDTISSTPTPTNTATPTSLPTPSEPRQVFLPLIRRSCVCLYDFADVLLVLDTSGSMSNPTEPGGPTKLAAAQSATILFLNLLAFPGDQAGIVAFASQAQLSHLLSNNPGSLIAATQALTADGATRIDLGIHEAHLELISPRH